MCACGVVHLDSGLSVARVPEQDATRLRDVERTVPVLLQRHPALAHLLRPVLVLGERVLHLRERIVRVVLDSRPGPPFFVADRLLCSALTAAIEGALCLARGVRG